MRGERPLPQGRPVQFLVELSNDADGRVSGHVAAGDRPPAPFSGWLELLRLLEGGVDDMSAGIPAPGDGHETEEQRWDGR